MLVTRILYAKRINKGKLKALKEQAHILGELRSAIWQEYGGLKCLKTSDRKIRDLWIKEKRAFKVLANAWKETLRDSINNIKLHLEAAKNSIKKDIFRHYKTKEEQKEAFTKLKKDEWLEDSFLHRKMRKAFKHGKNSVFNQIIVRSDDYKVFELNNQCWLSIPSLIKNKRIKIPLNTTMEYKPSGALRLIIKNNVVEVHRSYEKRTNRACGNGIIGIDKGYSEVFATSNNEFLGNGLGKILTQYSDKLKAKYQRRNKLLALVKKYQKTNKFKKANRIEQNNLGKIKQNKENHRIKQRLKTLIYNACHQVIDRAKVVVCEDLKANFSKKTGYGKNTNRRLNSWVKGLIEYALKSVAECRGSALHLVNPAYTSQCDSFCNNLLLGCRKGNDFYPYNGGKIQADYNAARNILARYFDKEIKRDTPFNAVKEILLKRTDSYRLTTV
ncbi:IS200/IS605 family element transposase accessory protein TnpB [Helicobacter pylori]|uniref:zinc ribbon domain-containing protein n=1 Tax=Helicobacter pylori TaxID=210 RepID=UPI00026A21BF|nr:IS200/IS605 family element transposase accessory protein TnpB [Helicobacter pylori]EJB56245.1 transposase, IS605 OrfB family [Helicobacter pylori Hp H-28]